MKKIIVLGVLLFVGVNYATNTYLSVDLMEEFRINQLIAETTLQDDVTTIMQQVKYDVQYMTHNMSKYSTFDNEAFKREFVQLAKNRKSTPISPETRQRAEKFKRYIMRVAHKNGTVAERVLN